MQTLVALILLVVASMLFWAWRIHKISNDALNALAAVFTVISGAAAIVLFILPLQPAPPDIKTATPTFTPTPTPIPYGPTLLKMDFTEIGDGQCYRYDPNILGYELHKYYIQPPSVGYISACKSGDWGPQVSLEVEAYPEGDLAIFGYGIIVGWQGGASGTTDACTFAVKRTVESQTVSKAFVSQRIDGTGKMLDSKVLPFPLDEKPHKIRIVFLTHSLAVGYIDNHFVGEFEFDHCEKGKIGLVAWGTGETKIYFDNFLLSSLP